MVITVIIHIKHRYIIKFMVCIMIITVFIHIKNRYIIKFTVFIRIKNRYIFKFTVCITVRNVIQQRYCTPFIPGMNHTLCITPDINV